MSEEQLKVERVEKFIKDYEKLLAQPGLSKESKKRAIEDVEALKDVLNYGVQYLNYLERRRSHVKKWKEVRGK